MNGMTGDASSWDAQRIAQRLNAHTTSDPATRAAHGDHDLPPHHKPTAPLRPAAVLVGLVARPASLNIVLTRRTEHLEHHPGQISFPGGHVEPSDPNSVAAALRETEEEIGFPAQRIDVLGQLDTYITQTGFCITPVVGLLRPPFRFTPDPHEVAEIFEVPLSFVLNPANHHRQRRVINGTTRQFHILSYAGYEIWGATAGILINFYTRLRT